MYAFQDKWLIMFQQIYLHEKIRYYSKWILLVILIIGTICIKNEQRYSNSDTSSIITVHLQCFNHCVLCRGYVEFRKNHKQFAFDWHTKVDSINFLQIHTVVNVKRYENHQNSLHVIHSDTRIRLDVLSFFFCLKQKRNENKSNL